MMNATGMGWFWIWIWIWPTLMVIGLVLLGYLTYRLIAGRDANAPGTVTGPARRILDERFARGEIDEDDYRRRRAELS